MCALVIMLLTGPRFMIILWWLIWPKRWESAFDTAILPILGAIFLPWTTLVFVIVAPAGSVEGGDWGWLVLAFLGDFFTHSGGIFLNRGRMPRTTP